MEVNICPSLFAADLGNLSHELSILERCGIKEIHIDVMDGNFVPNIAFGPDQVKMLRPLTNLKFDAHLMVVDPDRFIEPFVSAGADLITVHAEACKNMHRTIQKIKNTGKKVGVSLNPGTPLEDLKYVMNRLDRILIMTVNPGFGGQKFIDDMRHKIMELKEIKEKEGYSFDIQVDGGINKSNIKDVINCGAESIVIGSALFERGKTESNIAEFYKIIRS